MILAIQECTSVWEVPNRKCLEVTYIKHNSFSSLEHMVEFRLTYTFVEATLSFERKMKSVKGASCSLVCPSDSLWGGNTYIVRSSECMSWLIRGLISLWKKHIDSFGIWATRKFKPMPSKVDSSCFRPTRPLLLRLHIQCSALGCLL